MTHVAHLIVLAGFALCCGLALLIMASRGPDVVDAKYAIAIVAACLVGATFALIDWGIISAMVP